MNGYWIVLGNLVLWILILTGWREKVTKYISIPEIVGLLLIIAISSSSTFNRSIHIFSMQAIINDSWIVILLFIWFTYKQITIRQAVILVGCAIIISLAYVLVYASSVYATSFQAVIFSWTATGMLLLTLKWYMLTERMLLIAITIGLIFGEWLLSWQLNDLYVAQIATLRWWDHLFVFFIFTALLYEVLYYTILFIKNKFLVVRKKMKS